MNKTLTFRQVAALKRTAQNNYPNVAKVEKLQAKIGELQEEIDILNTQIAGAEMGSRAMTGGYSSFQLIDREVISTGKFDKEGRELKQTRYIPRVGALKLNDNGSYDILLGGEPASLFDADNEPVTETVEPLEETL